MSSSGSMSGADQQHSNNSGRTSMANMNMINNGGGMGGSSSSVSGMNSMSGGMMGGGGGGGLGMMNMMSRGGSVGGGGGGMLDSWGGSRRSDAIIVRNLAPDYTWQMLKDRFTHVGDIKYAEMKERGTGVIR